MERIDHRWLFVSALACVITPARAQQVRDVATLAALFNSDDRTIWSISESMEAGSRIEPAEAQWKERTPPMDQREKKPVDLDEPYGTSMVFDREQAKVYMVGYTGEPSAGTSYTFGMQEYEALLRIGTRDFRVTLLDPLHSKACMAGSRCVRLSSVHPGKSASTVDIYMYQGGRASGAAKH